MSIFKAYDIRGVYEKELTAETAYKIGRAFVTFLKLQGKTVSIGRDMRTSSPELHNQLIKGLTDQGANVIDIGLAATPMFYFSVAKYGYDAGIEITASHNPGEYNGFKMVTKAAIPLSGETGIKDVEKLVAANEFVDVDKKGEITTKEVLKDYLENILSKVDVSRIKKYKIVVDAGNAMAGMIIPPLFEKLPCELIPLFMELDGSFPNHEANPSHEENLVALKEKVLETGADLGVAFDGDADRIIFLNEKGEKVPGDLLGAVVAEIVLEKHKGANILYDLRSSRTVKETIEAAGGHAIKCRVGHSFIKKQMRDDNAEFALEQSAHYYLTDNFVIESPNILMLMLFEAMSKHNAKLSELITPLEKYFATGELNSTVADKDIVLTKLEEEFKDGQIMKLDGLSVDYDDWWFNVRASNTEPLLRLNLEAETVEKMQAMKNRVLGIIRSA